MIKDNKKALRKLSKRIILIKKVVKKLNKQKTIFKEEIHNNLEKAGFKDISDEIIQIN